MKALRRTALALLGAIQLSWGVWAYAAPRNFFDTFPGAGHHWTAAYPPFNEHLVADVGATFFAFGVLLVLAAIVDDRRVTGAVVLGEVVFNALHLAYHAMHQGAMPSADYPASLVSLALGVVVPLLLLLTYRRD